MESIVNCCRIYSPIYYIIENICSSPYPTNQSSNIITINNTIKQIILNNTADTINKSNQSTRVIHSSNCGEAAIISYIYIIATNITDEAPGC